MKIKRRVLYITFSLLTMSFYACLEDNKKEMNFKILTQKSASSGANECPKYILDGKDNNLNISILLDLSDRIEEPKIKEKDSAYLSSLSKAIVTHVQKKKLILLEDRMQLFFNPEPTDSKIDVIADQLSVAFNKETAKSELKEIISLYAKIPSELYNLARTEAKVNGGYPGSDIWGFFKYNVKDYCIDDCHRNILVILTDGYMYYNKTVIKNGNRASFLTPKSLAAMRLNKPNWEDEMDKKDFGFIPATEGLEDLEVLIIGVQSENPENPYARDVIQKYWQKWLMEMGIASSNIKIKNSDIASSMEKVIFDFILNK